MPGVTTELAPAKINLALHVLGRRSDGYHELDSVVAFASVGDRLTVSPAAETSLNVDGPFAGSVPLTSDNLVLKAHAALSQQHDIPPVAFHLTKNLPVASGIGGGSADAAAALRLLMRFADVSISPDALHALAISLGADVPVCLHGKACRMKGVGEVIIPVDAPPAPAIVLANPLQACPTPDVFRAMGLVAGQSHLDGLELDDPAAWRNDMTLAAVKVLPGIGDVLDALERLPKRCAVRMSGSGATCFALFDTIEDADEAALALKAQRPGWWIAAAHLS